MHDILLTNGDRIPIKVNFLTSKLMIDENFQDLEKQLQKHPKDQKLKMKIASKLIYIILRSNGIRVDEEEALMLVPLDDKVLETMFREFGARLEEFKKKQGNKM